MARVGGDRSGPGAVEKVSSAAGSAKGSPGFSVKDADGRWTGMDADFCRAVAAAALGDGEKVAFVPLFASARFPALKSNRIDLLARNTTQTLGPGGQHRDAVRRDALLRRAVLPGPGRQPGAAVRDLDGASICVLKESTHVVHLADYFQAHGLGCISP